MNIYYTTAGASFIVLSIVLIVRKDWREKLVTWFPGLLLIAGGILAFAGTRKTQKARRETTPTNPITPPTGAIENDKSDEIDAEIHVIDNASNLDDDYLRKRAERLKREREG